MEQIIKLIKDEISNFRNSESGANQLFLIQDNEQSLGDESGVIHIVYVENKPTDDDWVFEKDLFEFYTSLYHKIKLEMQKEIHYRNVELPESSSSSASLVYVSNCNDLFKIQITDEHLHIIQFYSGQY